jgi:hypothetical protein
MTESLVPDLVELEKIYNDPSFVCNCTTYICPKCKVTIGLLVLKHTLNKILSDVNADLGRKKE